ncbi:MAG: hypothetical protein LBC09_06250 [Helicobacteraceae bacterium]|jgi:hypothetical protein|nr:hypothetical protein [Helicobacteraceae bacterium]
MKNIAVGFLSLAVGFLPMFADPSDIEAMQGEWFGTIYGEFDAAAITDAKATIKADRFTIEYPPFNCETVSVNQEELTKEEIKEECRYLIENQNRKDKKYPTKPCIDEYIIINYTNLRIIGDKLCYGFSDHLATMLVEESTSRKGVLILELKFYHEYGFIQGYLEHK